MGSVYLAWDPVLERQLAIKLLRDDMDELRERFAREARAVARLSHPHIVTIFDVGEQDGHPFIAMEYIQGDTLAAVVQGGTQLPVWRKMEIIDQVCDGLGFAHKNGLVHRDIKPANVMVEPEGGVKILDFGIARVAESGMTIAGMLIGTLNYMSPEQVAGTVVDPRSDIFAVGALTYELLSHTQAFPGGLHNGILARIMHEHPPALETLCPSLDAGIIAIVRRALEKDPSARYQDLAAMRRDLHRVRHRLEHDDRDDSAQTLTVAVPPTPTNLGVTRSRRESQREALQRLREAQLTAHLETARRAFDAGDFDAAIAAGEQALLLDPDEARIVDLVDRAHVARERRHLHEVLKRGEDLLQAGAPTQAIAAAEEALAIAPETPTAIRLRESARRLQLERERAEAARLATQRAQAAFDRGAWDEAVAASDEALMLVAGHEPARSVRQRAQQALDLARQARIDAALARAEATDSHEDAIEWLREALAIDEGRDDVRARLSQRQAALDVEVEQRRLAQERDRKIADGIAQAAVAPHDTAITMLEALLPLDPAREDVLRMLDERRQLLEREREEQRRLAQLRARITDLCARAEATADHEAAIQLLTEAHELDPARADVDHALEARRSALEEQQRQERDAEERANEIAIALDKSTSLTSHEEAVDLLSAALKLDPGRQDVRDRLLQRQAALDAERLAAREVQEREERIRQGLARATAAPSHEYAIALLESLLVLDEGRDDVLQLLQVRRAALERDREEERRRQLLHDEVTGLIQQAEAERDHEAAIAILARAAARDPDRTDANEALQARTAALEQEREQQRQAIAREHEIQAALVAARDTTSHQEALERLRAALALDPARADVQADIEARQQALDLEQRQAREERERRARVSAAIQSAAATTAHEAAIAMLVSALERDPEHPELVDMLRARQTALQLYEQEQQERRLRVVAGMEEARNTASHAEAVQVLTALMPLAPDDAALRALLDERQTALMREREAERAERERQERVAAALALARTAPSPAAAVAILEKAQPLAPDHDELLAMLSDARARLAQALEEERLARERRDRVKALLTQARAAASHEAAIGLLGELLEIDPAHADGRRLLAQRQAALGREQEQARRTRDIEAARQAIVQSILAGEFVAAEAELVRAEREYQAGRLLKAERKQLQRARAAANPASAETSWARAGIVGGIAAGVLLVAGIGYVALRPAPNPPPATAAVTSTVPPDQPSLAPAPTTTIPAPPATPPAVEEPVDAPPVGTDSPTADVAASIAAALRDARQAAQRGEYRRAMSTIGSALRLDPGNRDLQVLSSTVVRRASENAERARIEASRRGEAMATVRAYREGEARQADAARRARAGQPDVAVRLLEEAIELFASAQPPPVTIAQGPPPGPQPLPPTSSTVRPDTPVRPPATTTVPPVAIPEPPVAPPQGPRPGASDQTLILAVLREYAAAYEKLDADAVVRVFPSVNASALSKSFSALKSQQVEVSNERVQVDGATAVVRCRVLQTFDPRIGDGRTFTVNAEFRLQKSGNRWVIVERR